MVYRLDAPIAQENLRLAAALLPELAPTYVEPYPHPLVVPAPGESGMQPLTPTLQQFSFALHNAGGAAAQLLQVAHTAPWLGQGEGEVALPPNGAAVALALPFCPAGPFAAGSHRAEVRLRLSGAGLREERLTIPATLQVPDAPVPWFAQPQVVFAGHYPATQLRNMGHKPVRILYEGQAFEVLQPGKAVRLYPGCYHLEGPPGDVQLRPAGGVPTKVALPGPLRIGGPKQQVRLYNLGSHPLRGRLLASAPWLQVAPDQVDLAPGATARIEIECFDDGQHFGEHEAALLLRPLFDATALAVLPVRRAFTLPGPRPEVALAQVALSPTYVGGTASGTLPVRNAGQAPLRLAIAGGGSPLQLLPGEQGEIDVAIGPPATDRPQRLQGHLHLRTNGVLPFHRVLCIPYAGDVVATQIANNTFDFGAVRYREERSLPLEVRRTDGRRPDLYLDLPPEWQGLVQLFGRLLIFRNRRLAPVVVDGFCELRDRSMGGQALGRLQVRGQALVPALAMEIPPPVRVLPGRPARVEIAWRDAGGGLEIATVAVNQPWAQVERVAQPFVLQVALGLQERGERQVVLTIHSNDYAQPVQAHTITLLLTPTRWMRLGDQLRALSIPLQRGVAALLRELRTRWRERWWFR